MKAIFNNLIYSPEIGIIHEPHLYKYKSTKEDIINQKKLDRKENIRWITDLLIGFIGFPMLAGFIGWLLPLEYCIFTGFIIGFISVIWFTGRRG